MRCTSMRYTPVRYTPKRYTPVRYTPMRHPPVKCTARRMHTREVQINHKRPHMRFVVFALRGKRSLSAAVLAAIKWPGWDERNLR